MSSLCRFSCKGGGFKVVFKSQLRPCRRVKLWSTVTSKDGGLSLSELIAFESDTVKEPMTSSSTEDPTKRAQDLLSRASRVIAEAKALTTAVGGPEDTVREGQLSSTLSANEAYSSGLSSSTNKNISQGSFSTSSSTTLNSTRSILRASLEAGQQPAAPGPLPKPPVSSLNTAASAPTADTRSTSSKSLSNTRSDGQDGRKQQPGGSATKLDNWAEALFNGSRGGATPGTMPSYLNLKEQPSSAPQAVLEFAEPTFFPSRSFLELKSQEDMDIRRARMAELPPLQSVLELTSASRPPSRQTEIASESAETSDAAAVMTAPTELGKMLMDGEGVLGDGTRWEKKSGEEFGADGYWKRWTQLSGVSADGSVSWEECWWEASDYKGFRELGAAKKGNGADGAAWNEAWSEKMYHDSVTQDKMVERTAHKWARDASTDEWEEQWGEKYSKTGPAMKWADKWARQENNVWHERWGEDYDGAGGCVKYTDKWAERLREGQEPEQWGDKWKESFKDGKGSKHGEVWSVDGYGDRYQRWWNEEHFGNGHVRKYGNSTGGEYWDSIEQMDTYYNPIPHFGYELAVKHSPKLVNIPLVRPGHRQKHQQRSDKSDVNHAQDVDNEEGLGDGIGAL